MPTASDNALGTYLKDRRAKLDLVAHPVAGEIALEYSTFAVDGRPDLDLVIYNPATPADADRIRTLLA